MPTSPLPPDDPAFPKPDDGPCEIRLSATPPGGDTPAIRKWMEDKAREQGFIDLRWDEDGDYPRLYGTPAADEPVFSEEKPPVLSEPHRVTRALFEAMPNRAHICAWAQEHLHLALDARQKRVALIDQVMAHPGVEEPTEPTSEEGAES